MVLAGRRQAPAPPRRASTMAKLTIVPKLAAGSVTLDQIPAEFIAEFEEAYEALRTTANGELRVEFDDEAERTQWLTWAKSYGEQRMTPDGVASAALKVRATPKRNLPKTVAYISITADLEANGEANTHQ